MRKGYINRGFVRRTRNQEKKHYTQFTYDELLYLENKIRSLDMINLKPSAHLLSKPSISYKLDDIMKTLMDKDVKDMIIEFNSTKKGNNIDKRVLLRSKDEYEVKIDNNIVKCNLCFVVSLLNNEIVTVYYNESKDNHNTINWYRYNANLKIIV